MTLFYTLLHATLLTTHLWAAAAAGGEGAEGDDFITKTIAEHKKLHLSPKEVKEDIMLMEAIEKASQSVPGKFREEYPVGFHLTTPKEFWEFQDKKVDMDWVLEVKEISPENHYKFSEGCMLEAVYRAFYDSERDRVRPKWLAFVEGREKLASTQTYWQHIQQQVREAKASANREEALIALLPEELRSVGLNEKELKKADFMLFSAPVVASPAWDALTEEEKIKRFNDSLIIDAITMYGIPE